MKFVSYDLVRGKFVNRTSYLAKYLLDHGIDKVDDFPENEFYFIDSPMSGFHIFNVIGIDHIHPRLLQDVRDKKAGLIFNCEDDTQSLNPTYQKQNNANIPKFFKVFSKLANIDPQYLMYIDANFKTEEILKKYNLHGSWSNQWEYFLHPVDDPESIIAKITNKDERDKKFLYFGGKAREFRTRFLNSCFKIPNFKEESYYSSGSGYFIDTETKEPKWMDTQVLDLPNIDGGANEWEVDHITSHFHLTSYINIIPMSYFYLSHDRLEINEKLFKPIASLQPFLVLGQIGTLKALKQLGYKTFDKWFDESYDSIMDDDLRYQKILNEVKRLSGMSKKELSEMIYDMLPVLKYNYELKKERTKKLDYRFLDKLKKVFNQK